MSKEDEKTNFSKRLPRVDGKLAATFTANGNKYSWLSEDDIPIGRFSKLSNLFELFYSGFDSFQSMSDYLNETNREIIKKTDGIDAALYCIQRNNSFLDNIIRKSSDRDHIAMYMAACMCVREGDKVQDFTNEKAEQYIADWKAEGYAYNDFFSIAGSVSSDFMHAFQQKQRQMEKIRGMLKAASITG